MVKLTEDMVVARSRGTDIHNVKKLNCWLVLEKIMCGRESEERRGQVCECVRVLRMCMRALTHFCLHTCLLEVTIDAD